MATVENNMKYVRLGKSGLKVSQIILGCMSYGDRQWRRWVLSEEEGIEHIKVAYDLGINAFDTANVYSHGLSEIILGKAIKKYNLPRDEIVVMTKARGIVGRTQENLNGKSVQELDEKLRYVNQHGLSRKYLFQSVQGSLKRLQLDYIDLLQCHRWDPLTPVEETMEALHDLVKAGLVRYIGMSSCWAWQFYKMQAYAKAHNLTEFVSMQNFYNPLYREEDREMMPMLKDLGVGVIPWSPLANGFLARPFDNTIKTFREDGDTWGENLASVPYFKDMNLKIQELAKTHNCSMAQVVLAWHLSKDFMTAPIVGTTSIEKLKDAVGAVHVKLSPEEVKAIDDFYQPRAIMGHS